MKRVLSVSLMWVLCAALALAKGDSPLVPEYQIEGAGTGQTGVSLVLVTIVNKKNNVPETDFARAAVHGVLFRGYSNLEGYSSTTFKPLMGSPLAEQQHADFFQNFFTNGYANYVQVQSDSRRVVKVGKEYKIKTVVAVSSSLLRGDLEKAGLLKKLTQGW